jgi:amino acid transporter
MATFTVFLCIFAFILACVAAASIFGDTNKSPEEKKKLQDASGGCVLFIIALALLFTCTLLSDLNLDEGSLFIILAIIVIIISGAILLIEYMPNKKRVIENDVKEVPKTQSSPSLSKVPQFPFVFDNTPKPTLPQNETPREIEKPTNRVDNAKPISWYQIVIIATAIIGLITAIISLINALLGN